VKAGAPVLFVVDDDPSVRTALSRLLGAAGYRVESFPSADDFLAAHREDGPGCLILDVHLPGLGGLDLQEALSVSKCPLPIVFITGVGDIPTSVRAMKAGAVDFLPKPFESQDLLDAVARALERDAAARAGREESRKIAALLGRLTPREREVFALVVTGMLNREIADGLGASEKTIKVHRGRVMEKLGAASLADLVRLADRAGVKPPGMP
jgi:FixJ family two-component response regulator